MNDILFIMCTSPTDKHNTTFIADCQLTSQNVLTHVLVFDPTIPSSSLMYNVETHSFQATHGLLLLVLGIIFSATVTVFQCVHLVLVQRHGLPRPPLERSHLHCTVTLSP